MARSSRASTFLEETPLTGVWLAVAAVVALVAALALTLYFFYGGQ
jgi:hypothetical protein